MCVCVCLRACAFVKVYAFVCVCESISRVSVFSLVMLNAADRIKAAHADFSDIP